MQVPEFLLGLAVLAGFGWLIAELLRNGYLPQPLFYVTSDTFMDWFSPAYWANNPGAYDVWRTIYPPFSFVFLRLFSVHACYGGSPFIARDCDWMGVPTLLAFYALGMAAAARSFWIHDPRTAIPRAVALTVGLPMLFALERGNLLVPCFVFFVVAHGGIVKSERVRAVAAAVTVNFKPYLLAPLISLAIKRRWSALELAVIATVLLYVVSIGLEGAGTPWEIIENTNNWVKSSALATLDELHYSTSFAALLQLPSKGLSLLPFIPSRWLDNMAFWIPLATLLGQALVLAVLAGAWLQPAAVPVSRLTLLPLAALLIAQSPGGYVQIFVVFLVFLERWNRPGPIIALIAAYITSIPADWVFSLLPDRHDYSWITGQFVTGEFGLAIGMFLRPALLILMVWALALDSLHLIVKAHLSTPPMAIFGDRHDLASAMVRPAS